MCHQSCLQFGRSRLSNVDITDKKVIEVGARDVNGSLRAYVENLKPSDYIGVDIIDGPGVDQLCDIHELTKYYGRESFDLVICMEVIEHVRDWGSAISNLKNILKPNGVILLTTRSIGFGYHGYPSDFWRYEVDDMEILFSDFSIDVIEKDIQWPGVFVKAYRPTTGFIEINLKGYELYSIITGKRSADVYNYQVILFKLLMMPLLTFARLLLPTKVKSILKRIVYRKKS